jgi:hypothetical protein
MVTVEAVGVAKGDDIDGENSQGFGETPLGWS